MDLNQDNIDSLEQMLSVGLEFNEAIEIIDDVRQWCPKGVIRCLGKCKLTPEGQQVARELAEED